MSEQKMSAEERIHKAKIKLQETHPFFAYLVMHMRAKELPQLNDGRPCTMAVDKFGNLYYNPEFVDTLSDDILRSALAHEVMHIILNHLTRRKPSWDPNLDNIAADVKCNDILQDEGFELDKNWIVPTSGHTWTFEGKAGAYTVKDIEKKAYEEVYAEIMKNAKGNQKQIQVGQAPQGMGGSSFDQHLSGDEGASEAQGEDGKGQGMTDQQLEEEWKMRASEAASYAKQRGRLSANMQSMVDGLVEAKVDWRTALMKFITQQNPCDFTWMRRSKTSHAIGVYLPGNLRESLDVTLHIDTSGSVSKDDLEDFLSEVRGILTSFEYVNITLITCDAEVQDVFELTPENVPELADLPMRGRGGTSHTPVVDWIGENQPECRVFVSLTDGYSDIERCYDYLPDNCHRLILLSGYSGDASDFEAWADVLKLPERV
jgi:predicted metal-dependent peptidase